jgi:hypothetical protein
MSGDLGFEELAPGRYDGVVERIRYNFGAATRIVITYKLTTANGPRRVREEMLISAPPASVSYFPHDDRVRTRRGHIKNSRTVTRRRRRTQITTRVARRHRTRRHHAQSTRGRIQLPGRDSRGETVTRRGKPYEFEEDPDPFVAVGIDAEWVFESAGQNRILSYQFALLNGDSEVITKLIVYSKNGERITIEHGLTRVMLKARKECVIAKVPNRFIIAGHFTRADMTTFSDFGYFKRRLGAVRKTYATTEIPLSLRLVSNEGPVRCRAVIIDTMLLAPAGTSLEKLGKLLDMPKIDLPEGYSKDRMDVFLRDHPKLFEEYALRDAVIPALWVVKTYGLLLDRLGIKKKVVTLGGAAVELVKGQAKACGIELHEFLGRDKKKKQPRAHLMSTIAIAAQAYHGGYNLAAALGFSPEGKQLHDLDIRSAYTTALAFIGVPDWHNARHCIELTRLAVIDEAMTAALVEFRSHGRWIATDALAE